MRPEEIILYEDADIIAVNKPSGIPSQKDASQAPDIKTIMEERCGMKLHLQHRLDRMVSGVMIFAKTPDAATLLQKIISSGEADKRYTAFVYGAVEKQRGIVESMLVRRESTNEVFSYPVGGKPPKGMENIPAAKALTEYSVVNRWQRGSELEIRLLTGRHHQIRAHMCDIRRPIIGDKKYGAGIRHMKGWKEIKISRIALHASSLTFPLPSTGDLITVAAPLPEELTELRRRLS